MSANAGPEQHSGLLARLGLRTREHRAWGMYDWGISGMQTVIMTSVFQIYFIDVAGRGHDNPLQWWSGANTVGAVIVALLAPILGALADYAGIKKRFLALWTGVGASAIAGMWFIHAGDLRMAAVLYIIALIGATASMAFYESLLPHITRTDEMDRVSSGGYALGYLGGGILLLINILWIFNPQWFGLPSGEGLTANEATLPTRLAFVSVAVWWVIFSIPIFKRVSEPARRLEADEKTGESPVRMAFVRLGETLRELRGYKHAFLMLIAFMIYNDGIQTIIKMAAAYGTDLGIDRAALIGSILIVQFVGVPFAFLFGNLAGRIGARNAIFLGLLVYVFISVLGYFMTTATHFFILAGLVGMVQGGTQALSRSLFASMIPRHKSGEFFGFYSVFEKFAGIFGPLLFFVMLSASGSSRNAILSVILFFVLGAALLWRVDPKEGQRVARLAEEETEVVGVSA